MKDHSDFFFFSGKTGLWERDSFDFDAMRAEEYASSLATLCKETIEE